MRREIASSRKFPANARPLFTLTELRMGFFAGGGVCEMPPMVVVINGTSELS